MRLSRFQYALIAYIALFVIVSATTMLDYGLSWDEPTRWRSGDKKLAYYERLFGEEGSSSALQEAPRDMYPGLYDIPLAYARSHLDVNEVVLSRIWNVGYGFLAILVPVVLTRILLNAKSSNGQARSAVDDFIPFVSGFSLILCPEFYGHIFINPKDVPFAAMYGWAVVFLVFIIRLMPRASWRTVVLFGFVSGLTMAIRPPGLVVICYFGLLVFGWHTLTKTDGDKQNAGIAIIGDIARLAASFAVATIVLFPFWPRAHGDLFNMFIASVSGVADLQSSASAQPVLFAGAFYDAGSTPWFYVVWMFVIKQPVWFVALVFLGIGLAVMKWRKIWSKIRIGNSQVWGLSLAGFALCFPIGYVAISGSAIHNGFRHMLYVLPMAAVIVGFAWRYLWISVSKVPRWRAGFVGVSIVLAALTITQLVRLHPYQYMYYNAFVGGTSGAFGKYETEYWFTCGKAGAEFVNSDAESINRSKAKVFVLGARSIVRYYLDDEFELTNSLSECDYYIGRPIQEALDLGDVVGEVSRLGVPLLVVVRRVE